MKKFLLSLFSVALFGGVVNAQSVEMDFSANDWGLPEAKANAIKDGADHEYSNGSYTITLNSASGDGYYFNSQGYLMLGKANAYLQLPAFDFDVASIEVVGRTGASTSTQMNVFVGDNAVSTATKGSAGTNVYEIASAYKAAGNIYKIKVTSSHNAQITKITVYPEVASSVATPTFSEDEGVYSEPINLTISAAEGCSIYYTLDGTAPSNESEAYTEPIEISEYTVVKAIAYDQSGAFSSVASATYKFQNTAETAMSVADALAWVAEGKDATTEQYIVGYITSITEVSTSYGNARYYIADTKGDTETTLDIYRGLYLDGAKFTSADQIEVDDKVVIYGKLTTYSSKAQVAQGSYIVSQEKPEVVPSDVEAPTFSEEEGVYTEAISVEITAAEGCAIYYTLDGTDPSDESAVYEGAIEISEYTVLKAIAVDENDTPSNVTKAVYAFQNTKETAMSVTDALAWIAAGKDATTEQYVEGVVTSITEISTSYGNGTYAIADEEGGEELVIYRGYGLDNTKFTSTDDLKVGYKVIVYGTLVDYNGTKEMNSGNYIVSLDASSGVEGVEIENADAPVVYYNLQGVRVDNPTKGLYIKQQGNKATKVVL